jgi:PTH1 family peptidyl-tRNA hydrolase
VARYVVRRAFREADFLVVGLGNPGKRFSATRHNVGAWVIERLADRLGVELERGLGLGGWFAQGRHAGRELVLFKPAAYMNESGLAVRKAFRQVVGSEPSRLVVCHDELDLPPGQVRLKADGGTAGHRGLQSVVEQLGTRDFFRIRIGIGRPPSKHDGAMYVLSPPEAKEKELISEAVERAAEAVLLLVEAGASRAMQLVNQRA